MYINKPNDYWQFIIIATMIGSILCIPMSYIFTKIQFKSLFLKIILATFICAVAAILWSIIKHSYYNIHFVNRLDILPLLSYKSFMHHMKPLLLWSALYFTYIYHQAAVRNKIQTLKALNLAHENQLKLLSYQLNPHFLFNVLNSIGALVLKYDDMPLYNTITKLSDFLRYTLDSKPWEKVTVKQEILCTQQYLDIQKIRFDEKLSIEFHVPKELQNQKIPSLILLPLIENAIKHTIDKSAKHVKLYCKVNKEDNILLILLENTLENIEINQPFEKGVGIENVKQRLKAYYGKKGLLKVNISENTYQTQLQIPIK